VTVDDPNNNVMGNENAGHVPGWWNEGVGEHVRTRFRPGLGPGEIAEPVGIRNERRKLVSSAGPVFEKLKIRSSRLT
jgi:hypothetical protein